MKVLHFTRLILSGILLVLSSALANCQALNEYVLLARRQGTVQFLDPKTLRTIGTLNFVLQPNTTGLNGIWADAPGRTIYVDGPIPSDQAEPQGCCWLYSVDLSTFEAKAAAGIWGSDSRRQFVHLTDSLLQTSAVVPKSIAENCGDRLLRSPDLRWWSCAKTSKIDLYDAQSAKLVRTFAKPGSGDDSAYIGGAWLGSRLFVYVTQRSEGKLWEIPTDGSETRDLASLPQPASVPNCDSSVALTDIVATPDRLIVYEQFGGKLDRRERCDNVPGGALIVDPQSGQVLSQVSSQYHFWRIIPNQTGSELYGITSLGTVGGSPAELLRIDAHTGNVLELRPLDGDFWSIAVAGLKSSPSGDQIVTLPTTRP